MAKQAITSLGNMLLIHFPVSVLENYPNADLSPLRRFVSHLFALFGAAIFTVSVDDYRRWSPYEAAAPRQLQRRL
jgi:hypothetical protein